MSVMMRVRQFILLLSLVALHDAVEDAERLTLAASRFGISLFKKLPSSSEENVFFSPYSVSTAMGMVYAGARGTTRQNLFTGMGYQAAGLSDGHIVDAYRTHTQRLLSTPSNSTLKVANAAAIHDKQTVLDSYETALTESFRAQIHKVDFVSGGQAAVDLINNWVNDNTEHKIEKLFSEPLDPITRLVLLNAIYFKGKWNVEFDPQSTRKETFYNGGVSAAQVDTMHRTLRVPFADMTDELGVIAVDLPYKGLDFSMIILLPTERNGVEALKANLSDYMVSRIISSMREQKVEISLPKFKLETSYDLKETLKSMGIAEMFQSDADLSGIDGTRSLIVSDVVHKAVVEVNEEGAEAAGVTGVVTNVRTQRLGRPFKADHPFLFFIRTKPAGDILFAGQVNKL